MPLSGDLISEITYLIAHVFESKSAKLALWDSGDTEIKPGAVIFTLCVWGCVARKPEIEAVLDIATLCFGQVSTAKLA